MFCGKCGTQLPDGTEVCPYCQELLSDAPTVEVSVDPVVQDFDAPAKKPRKHLKKIIAAAIALVLVVVIAFNFQAIVGLAIKTFGSDADYFRYVEKKAFSGYTDTVTGMYGSAWSENADADSAVTAEMRLVLGDNLKQLLVLGGGTELDWLEDIVLAMDVNTNDSAQSVGVGLLIADEEILNIDVITDLVTEEIFVGILNLSDQYLRVPAVEVEYEEYDGSYPVSSSNAGMNSVMTNPEFLKAMPSEKELNELLDKYIEIVITQLDDVSKYSETLEIDGISQKCTVLEIEINQMTVANIAQAVLEEVRDDDQIESIFNDMEAFLKDEGLLEEDADGYDEFVTEIDYLLDDIKENIEDADEDEELLILKQYVNSKHEIVGCRIEVDQEEVFYGATARKGKNFATEVRFSEVVFAGSGTQKGNVITGEFELELDGLTVCELEVRDFNTKQLEDGYLNGNFRIRPSEALLSEMELDEDMGMMFSMFDFGLELNCENSKKSTLVEINLLGGDDVLFGISTSVEMKKSEDVVIPSGDKTVDGADEEAVLDWVRSWDTEKLVEAMEKAGLPDDILDSVESALEELAMELSY